MEIGRELSIIQDGLDQYHDLVGEVVAWYSYDTAASVVHSVYDEGGDLHWAEPIIIPTLWVSFNESTKAVGIDGREQFSTIHFAVSMATLVRCGLDHPGDYEAHLNDLVLYRGRFHEVGEYKPHGRLRGDLLVGVSGTQTRIEFQHLPDTVPNLV